MDNISELPEGIIHHILSLLRIDNGMQASLLSKTWLNAWRTRPTLDFDGLYLEKNILRMCDDYLLRIDKIDNMGRGLYNYVNQTLLRHREQRIPIVSFKLELRHRTGDEWMRHPLREEWIKTAIENRVKVIQLVYSDDTPSTIPQIILQCMSLEKLDLHGGDGFRRDLTKLQVPGKIKCVHLKRLVLRWFSLDEVDFQKIISSCGKIGVLFLQKIQFLDRPDYSNRKLQFPQHIFCPHLKRLRLWHVSLDDQKFQRIISSCKMIEFLSLYFCKGVECYKVTKLPMLKRLSIVTDLEKRVQVEAPSLEVFTACIYNATDVFPLEISALNLGASKNLRSLRLHGAAMTDGFFIDLGCKFPFLEDLTIEWCKKLKKIKISSPSLKSLRLHHWKSQYVLKELHVDAPSLARFAYWGKLIPFISFASASSDWISDIHIQNFGSSWFLLKDFLTKLNQSKISLDISFCSDIVTFNLEREKRRGSFLPECPVQELSIDDNSVLDELDTALLDGVFWVCRPKSIKQSLIGSCSKFNKFLFSVLINRRSQENEENYDPGLIKFWEKDLKKVKLETFAVNENSELAPCTLDWQSFLDIQKSRLCLFDLEWGIS